MRYRLPLIVLLTLPLQVVHAAGMKIMDQGIDGNIRSYRVFCDDGSRGGVTQRFETKKDGASFKVMGPDGNTVEGTSGGPPRLIETCAGNRSGGLECRSGWTVDEAARSFCR